MGIMDPIKNPFAPGAGTPPLALAGREELIERVRIAIAHAEEGSPTKSDLFVGLRGVGKTVLLDRMRENAEQAGILTMRTEAPEDRSLPALLAPDIRKVLLKLSRVARASPRTERASGASGFRKGT